MEIKEPLSIVVLAAGRGKRMLSDLPKVAFKTREKALIHHVLETAFQLNPEKIIAITGYKRELVEQVIQQGADTYALDKVRFVEQKEQLGTGHAVRCALPVLKDFKGTVLIMYGDVPLTRIETLQALLQVHAREKATITILSFITPFPQNYGRIIRDKKTGLVVQIKEARDCSPTELEITECNSGIYAVDSAFLDPALNELKNHNAQGEFYLTDIVEKAAKEGQTLAALVAPTAAEVEGVNTPSDLVRINQAILENQRRKLIDAGVIMEDPESVFIDSSATVSAGAVIGPNVQIKGKSSIAAGVVIEGSAYLENTIIHENARIKFCVRCDQAVIGNGAQIGPFANLRPGTDLAADVHIGNFVETKKAKLAQGVKANHLTYLGDCTIGTKTNVGAGTITCNYDGFNKYETIIGENVFIGSDTCLVAPVTIEDGSTTGAGSVITQKVEKDSLALTRAPQVSKSGWSKRKRDLLTKR